MGKSKNPEFGIHATWTIYRRILRWTTRSVDFTLFRPEDNPEASIYTYTYTYSSAAFLLLIKLFGIPSKSRCRAWVTITRALLNMWNWAALQDWRFKFSPNSTINTNKTRSTFNQSWDDTNSDFQHVFHKTLFSPGHSKLIYRRDFHLRPRDVMFDWSNWNKRQVWFTMSQNTNTIRVGGWIRVVHYLFTDHSLAVSQTRNYIILFVNTCTYIWHCIIITL